MNHVATFANGAWLATCLPAWRRFEVALRQPAEAQQCALRRLLKTHADCAYGRAHRFGEIRSYEEFRRRVPLVHSEELEPWIDRIRRGERRVLVSESVTRLVPTSGSTGGRKLIPFTASFQKEIHAAIAPWIVDLCREHPSVPFGRAYWSISPAISAAADQDSAVPIGFDDDSAYLGGIRQRLAEATFAVPSGLRQIADLEAARYFTLLCLLRAEDLRLVSVWHPSFFTLLLDALPRWWEALLEDVVTGNCRGVAELPGERRALFTATPQRRRADRLRAVGPHDPQRLWPHLRVVSCWGDAQATLPFMELRRRLPQVHIQPKGLLATEGFVTVPFRGQHPIAVASHFYEFEKACGQTLRAHELKAGEVYRVILSTGAGLWRYRLEDLVEVNGFVGATPSLRFLGRGSSVSDLTGEKLSEAFVTAAIVAACASSAFRTEFAMLAPEMNMAGRWGYTLYVDRDPPPVFLARLETELRGNPHYALSRDLGQLAPLRVFSAGAAAYETFSSAGLAKGQRFGEIKPQALSLRTDWRVLFSRNARASGVTAPD